MDQLVDRVLSAYGGRKIDSVKAYRMDGVVTAKMRQTEGSMIRLFARPDRLHRDRSPWQANKTGFRITAMPCPE